MSMIFIIQINDHVVRVSSLKLILFFFLFPAIADVGFAIWNRYSVKDPTPSLGYSSPPPLGYTAHIMGACAGLTVGLAVLKNFQQKLHKQYVCWFSIAIYLVCVSFAIFWNLFY